MCELVFHVYLHLKLMEHFKWRYIFEAIISNPNMIYIIDSSIYLKIYF